MKNNLIVFDIDGTLTNTNCVDSQLFEKAILKHLNINAIDTQWHNYKYSTDTGILIEIFQSVLNREIEAKDIELIQNIFVNYLSDAFKSDSSQCLPLAGAGNIFSRIEAQGWDIAIATGGWNRSATLKLKTAGIYNQSIPIAHSDDHIEREEIISIAISRAKKHYKRDMYSTIFYVGDRSWDKKAAENLNIGFIGVGDELKEMAGTVYLHMDDYTTNTLIDYLTHF